MGYAQRRILPLRFHEQTKQKLMRNRIITENGCWIYNRKSNNMGYGQIWVHDHTYIVHIIAYQIFVGEIAEGKIVRHLCPVVEPRCWRPTHLIEGTQKENVRDQVLAGHKYGQKLTIEQVRAIRREYAQGNVLQKDLAMKYGIGHVHISQIVNNVRWKDIQ